MRAIVYFKALSLTERKDALEEFTNLEFPFVVEIFLSPYKVSVLSSKAPANSVLAELRLKLKTWQEQ